MTDPGRHSSRTTALMPAILLAVASLAACQQKESPRKTGTQGTAERQTMSVESATPAPTDFFTDIDSASSDSILAYGRSLTYEGPGSGAPPGVYDEQRLLTDTMCDSTRTTCTVGPLARIEPQSRAYLLGESGVASGRIIARIINEGTDSYPKLALQPHDTVYWWADKAGPGGSYRSLYISSRRPVPHKRDSLYLHAEEKGSLKQAIARFLWVPEDEKVWTACDSDYCCRTSP